MASERRCRRGAWCVPGFALTLAACGTSYLVVGARPPTGSTTGAIVQVPVTLQPETGALCADLTPPPTDAGVGLRQSACNGGAAESWSLVALAPPAFEIVSNLSGMCLDHGNVWDGGLPVIQNPCWPGVGRQKWMVRVNGDGSYTFATTLGPGCLDDGDSGQPGTLLETSPCRDGASGQRFQPVPVANGLGGSTGGGSTSSGPSGGQTSGGSAGSSTTGAAGTTG